MADSKISALPAAAALAGGEAIPAVQAGGNVSLTPAQILSYVLGAAATTEQVQDVVGGFMAGGGGVTVNYNDAANGLTIGFDPANAGFVEAVQDMIGGFVAAGSGIALTYNDAANVLTIATTALKSNVTTSDPTASSDSAAGFAAGSVWTNTATGTRWFCEDAGAGAAQWIAQGALGFPGYLSGYSYRPAGAVVSSAVGADVLQAVAIVVPQRVTIASLAMNVSAAVAGNVRIGIYANAGSAPGAKLAEAATPPSTGSAATVQAALAANLTLNPGVYWLASLFSAGPTMTCASAADQNIVALLGAATPSTLFGTSALPAGVVGSATYANGLPASFGTSSRRYNHTPLVAITVA